MEKPARTVPLCVDLDGTLLKTDSLYETLCIRLKSRPISLIGAPLWLLGGKAALKERMSKGVRIEAEALPYNEEVLTFVRAEKAAGREIALVTAADRDLAEQVARHLELFDHVISSDGRVNLSGRDKASALVERFGEGGFDYIGNAEVDRPVWAKAREALVVSSDRSFVDRVGRDYKLGKVFPGPAGGLLPLLKAMRPHQWVKNLLVFAPLVLAHRAFDGELALQSLLAFVFFSLCASSVYLFNDLCDLPSDRRHSTKRNRPLAAGELSLALALLVSPLMVAAAFAGSLAFLPIQFTGTLCVYFGCTLAYSLFLKQIVAIDIVVLALLYTIRILAGGHATGLAVSQWLIAFSTFFFLSLACVKRLSELLKLRRSDQTSAHGRGYLAGDLEQISQFGSASAYLSVLVLAFYVSAPEVRELYPNPQALWFLCPVLLYWLTRVWILANRGDINEDPIVFAITDRVSYLVGSICAIILVVAAYS